MTTTDHTRLEVLRSQRQALQRHVEALLDQADIPGLHQAVVDLINIAEDHAVARHGVHVLQAIVGATLPSDGCAPPDVYPEDEHDLVSGFAAFGETGPPVPVRWPWQPVGGHQEKL